MDYTNISSKSDLSRMVSGWLENHDFCQYNVKNHDKLVERATNNMLILIRYEYNFEWGDDLPFISDHEFESCVGE